MMVEDGLNIDNGDKRGDDVDFVKRQRTYFKSIKILLPTTWTTAAQVFLFLIFDLHIYAHVSFVSTTV